MRPKSFVLLVLALGCGLVASIGINQVMMASKRGGGEATLETTPIYVAAAEIGMGDPISLQQVKLEEWPKNKVPAGALTSIEEVENRRCRVKFFEGEPILEAKLLAKGETGSNATDLIPAGFRTVAVKVDNVSSASGLIQPGDRVDLVVYVRADPNNGIHSSMTRTFLQNIKVFSVDQKFSRDKEDEAASSAKTISLLLTPEEAELVMLATKLGEIQLVMRSAMDDKIVSTAGAGVRGLMSGGNSPESSGSPSSMEEMMNLLNGGKPNGGKPAAPAAPQAAAVEPEPQPEPKGYRITIIRGPTVEEVFIPDDGGLPQAADGGEATNVGPHATSAPDASPDAPDDEGGGDENDGT